MTMPLSLAISAALAGGTAREHALYDGEDFELIVVLPPSTGPQEYEPLGLIQIGQIDVAEGLFLSEADGRRIPVARGGWEHFR